MAMFGIDFAFDRVYHSTTDNGDRLDRSLTLEKLWPHGFSTIGS